MAWTDPRTWVTDELVTAAMMNAHVRDNFNSVMHLIARKTADESLTSSVTLQDDASLILPVGANEIWRFEFLVLAEGTDMYGGFTFPASGRISFLSISSDDSNVSKIYGRGTNTTPTGVLIEVNLMPTPNYGAFLITGVFINASTAGSLTFQWCQQSSSGTASTVKANSTVWGAQIA